VPLAVNGVGLLAVSFLADVAGTIHGSAPWPVPPPEARLAVSAGYEGLYGSPHSFHQLGCLGVDWRDERLSLGLRGTLQPQADFFAYGARVAGRLWRPGAATR